MHPNDVFFIEELPEDKNQFNVAMHDWQKHRRRLKIQCAALIIILFSCISVPAGVGFFVAKYVHFEQQDDYIVFLPMVFNQGEETVFLP